MTSCYSSVWYHLDVRIITFKQELWTISNQDYTSYIIKMSHTLTNKRLQLTAEAEPAPPWWELIIQLHHVTSYTIYVRYSDLSTTVIKPIIIITIIINNLTNTYRCPQLQYRMRNSEVMKYCTTGLINKTNWSISAECRYHTSLYIYWHFYFAVISIFRNISEKSEMQTTTEQTT